MKAKGFYFKECEKGKEDGVDKRPSEQAEKQFEENIKDVDQDDLKYAANKGWSKIKHFGENPPEAIKQFWEDLKLMVGMIIDYVKGNYDSVPWNTIAAVTGAVIYFVSPIDVIPDFIPVAGYVDDALVIKLALDFIGQDLSKYKEWKEAKA